MPHACDRERPVLRTEHVAKLHAPSPAMAIKVSPRPRFSVSVGRPQSHPVRRYADVGAGKLPGGASECGGPFFTVRKWRLLAADLVRSFPGPRSS